jgi:hypothetical protein
METNPVCRGMETDSTVEEWTQVQMRNGDRSSGGMETVQLRNGDKSSM